MYNIVMLILVIKLFDPNSWLSKDRQKKKCDNFTTQYGINTFFFSIYPINN